MRTNEELKQIALDLIDGKIFCNRHCENPADHFYPLLFANDKEFEQMKIDKIDFIFEYIDQAEPTMVNGKPVFMSMNTLTWEESKIMFEFYHRLGPMKEQMQKKIDDLEL